MAVGPVGIEVQRPLPGLFKIRFVHHADRHLRPVPRRGHQPLRGVLRGVVARRNLLHLAGGELAGYKIVVVHRAGGYHRFIAQADDLHIELGVDAESGMIRRLGKLHKMFLAIIGDDPDLVQTVEALFENHPIAQAHQAAQVMRLAAVDHRRPVVRLGVIDRGDDQTKIFVCIIGADIKPVPAVIDIVLVPCAPR